MILRVWIVTGLIAIPLLAPGEKLNFYIPGDTAKSPTEKPAPKKSEPSSKEKAPPPKPTKPIATPPKPGTRSSSKPNTPFDPPMDEFGLARAFEHRWDFSSFIITPEEELRFRINAARTRTLRIARAFSALSSEVETRQRNLNTAALAAYLLSRDQATWAPLGGPSLTSAQMLAVRATMHQDFTAMHEALDDYDTLRNSLNKSAEELAALEKNGLDGATPNPLSSADRPTLPYTMIAEAETNAVLDERIISIEALKAILATEKLSISGDRRKVIAAFAPPPPQSRQTQAAPPFATDSSASGKNASVHASMKRPEQTALILPTPVNAPVHAVRDGVVAFAGPFRGYGGTVILEHEKGTFSIYSHLGTIEARGREAIKAGTVLGRAGILPELGNSGIHFQVRKGKEVVKPTDWLGDNVAGLLTK